MSLFQYQCLFQKRTLQNVRLVETHNQAVINDFQKARRLTFLLESNRTNNINTLRERINRRDATLSSDATYKFMCENRMPVFYARKHTEDEMMQLCSCYTCSLWFSRCDVTLKNDFLSTIFRSINQKSC